jgi:hypothetical protein
LVSALCVFGAAVDARSDVAAVVDFDDFDDVIAAVAAVVAVADADDAVVCANAGMMIMAGRGPLDDRVRSGAAAAVNVEAPPPCDFRSVSCPVLID